MYFIGGFLLTLTSQVVTEPVGTVGGSNKAAWGTKLPPTSISALAMV